jgi:uncharacterized alpha-E superfamily protein
LLGTTAGGVFWMFRYLERSENTARLVEAGFRMALTRSSRASSEWQSVVSTAGVEEEYLERYADFDGSRVVDFLLRDRSNPSSVLSMVDRARTNARQVRTALTREVWEATNAAWIRLGERLEAPVADRELPSVLEAIRNDSALVRGALHGTMLRNDIYNFARLGTYIERADSTARILDVKFYVLLPSVWHVGSQLDHAQWENVLRSLSAHRSFHWQNPGSADAGGIAEFIILDGRMPRSLAFCFGKIQANLDFLAAAYGDRRPSHHMAEMLNKKVTDRSIDDVFNDGFHEFLTGCEVDIGALAQQIEIDYRFYR